LLANAGSKDVTPDASLYRNTVFSLLFEGELAHPDKIRRRMEIAINQQSLVNLKMQDGIRCPFLDLQMYM